MAGHRQGQLCCDKHRVFARPPMQRGEEQQVVPNEGFGSRLGEAARAVARRSKNPWGLQLG